MRIAKMFLVLLSLSVLFTFSIQAAPLTETLAVQAISNDATEAKLAAGKLREMRQAGLDALFEKYDSEIGKYIQTGEKSVEWTRISAAIDNVAMQKDAYASRLFWLTDLEEAKRLSKETGKPILSLRLLGNLNEEFSCANSRFFRAVLYSKSGKLDANSRAFIRNQTGRNTLNEQEFGTLVSKLENLIALDTARNNFLLRPTLLVWLNKDLDKNIETLNKKVYDELFLTPNEDKWLGLYAPDVYTALDGNGITN